MYEANEPALTEGMVEAYIDRHGVTHLLTMIVNICHEKAVHCESDWQDRALASAWRIGARRIEKVAAYENWPL